MAQCHRPQERAISELRAAVARIEADLRSHHDPSWARLFQSVQFHGDHDFVIYLGHALVFQLYGPLNDIGASRDDIEQMLVDTVAMWPPVERSRRDI